MVEPTNVEHGESPKIKQPLPNATAVLVLGILSIVFGCCTGFIGLILAIIAIVLAQKDFKLYQANPEQYEESSIKNLNAGRITAIIGLVLGILGVLYYIFILSSGEFWDQYMEAIEKAREQA